MEIQHFNITNWTSYRGNHKKKKKKKKRQPIYHYLTTHKTEIIHSSKRNPVRGNCPNNC